MTAASILLSLRETHMHMGEIMISAKPTVQFLILALMLALPAPCIALSGDDGAEIPMPSGYQVEKSGDLSNAILSRLFGSTWGQIAGGGDGGDPIINAMNSIMGQTVGGKLDGGGSAPGSLGRFSGLIVSILGVVNVGAMAFVATAIIYMWGIFAVTTAHEGNKLGGSMYNSLWVPVRHACSFSLTVPILNGLSLMQVAIMACVGLSINFANHVWDASGNYIINHAHIGIIDSSTPMLETEVRQMIPMMFEGAVQQLLEQGATVDPQNTKDNGLLKLDDLYKLYNDPLKSVGIASLNADTNGKGAFLGGLMSGAKVYVMKDHEKGEAYLSLIPNQGIPASAFGGVRFDYPKMSEAYFGGNGAYRDTSKDAPTYYRLKSSLAEIRIRNTADLWGKVYNLAGLYLVSRSSGGGVGGCAFAPGEHCNGALDPVKTSAYVQSLIKEYTANVSAQSESAVKAMIDSERSNLKDAFRKAIDSENGQSKHGWLSAGLFTFTMAALQKRMDDTVMGHTEVVFSEQAQNTNRSSRLLPDSAPRYFSADRVSAAWGNQARVALAGMSAFTSNALMGGESYLAESGAAGDGSKLSQFGAKIMNYFLADGKGLGATNRGGMLNSTLQLLGTYDPIVVLQTFGNRLLDIAPAVFSGGALLDMVTDSMVGNGAVAMLMIAGITFAYIVPITPVIFWFKAILSWLYMVVEAMVSAPFWVCAHALPEGAGFAGQHARRGYLMLLDIIIRPCLLVLGAVFAIAIIQASGYMAYILFNAWFVSIAGTFIEIGIMADITFSILLMSIMYYISYTVFTRGVIYLPERVLNWCGSSSGGGLHDEAEGTAKIVAAGALIQSGGRQIGSAADSLKKRAIGAQNGINNRLKSALQSAADRKGAREQGSLEKGDTPSMAPSQE